MLALWLSVWQAHTSQHKQFLLQPNQPQGRGTTGFCPESITFLIYVNDLPTPHHKQNSLSQFADDTAQWAFSRIVRIAAKLLQQDLLKLAMWCAKWRIKLNPVKTKVIIFSRSVLARKTELNLKLYGETLKIYPQVKFLGITFDSQLNFKKHFEDILDHCNTRYHRLRLLVNKKWGPSPATLTQIYKQCFRPIFEYGSVSTITTSDNIISIIQRLQNKFIRLALRLPKHICPRILHDSSGLPYVKDRLLSCATKSLDRIAQNPLVGESISSHRLNPAWDRFPTPLSACGPSCEFLDYHTQVKFVLTHLLTVLIKHACHHNSFWGSRCVSSHAPTISLKPVLFTAI